MDTWLLLAVVLGATLSMGRSAASATAASVPTGDCARGRANVLEYGADPSGANDSAPAFRAAIAACQSVYAPAGSYRLRSPEPSGPIRPPLTQPTASVRKQAEVLGTIGGGYCPSDGRNCLPLNCSCPEGDGPPYNMAAGTTNPPCFACHPFMPPPAGFLDWSSLAVGGNRRSGGLIGDGPGVTILQVEYGGKNTSHLAAICGFSSSAVFRDFSLHAVSHNGTGLLGPRGLAWQGVGFTTFSAVALEMTSIEISGFIYGIRIRYTVMGSFSMLEIRDCACGIDLARSFDAFGSDDETSSSGWNAWEGGKEGGWYNNVVSFRNVHVQRGEIGIRATDMCSTLISCCTEGQAVRASDTDKTLLQPEDVGVGLWLESGNCNRSTAGGNNVIIDFYSEDTTNPFRFLDKTSVSVIGAFLMDPGGGAEHPHGQHDPLGWAAIYARNTKLSLQGIWGYWAGEFGIINVGSSVQGDSAEVFPVHMASSAVDDPLAQHHTCQCTVAQPSDCDAGQRSQAGKCYTATCPTGTMDGYRSCTCAWAHETDHSPPHGCTAEVHCVIESGERLPPNCSHDAIWSPPNSSQMIYSWDPRGSECLNATINCVAAMEYYCPRGGDPSAARAACNACGTSAAHKKALMGANCTATSIAQVCDGNSGGASRSRLDTFAPLNAASNYVTTANGNGDIDNNVEELQQARKKAEALEERVRVLEEQMKQVLETASVE